MPEDTTSADAQAANADPAQAATSSNAQAATDTEPVSLEDARKLRSEARAMRDRLKAAESSAKELADLKAKLEADKLTETERWQKQATDLQAKYDADTSALTEHLVELEVRVQAAEMGVKPQYLKRVAKMLDWEDLEFDEASGMPTNVEKVLTTLIKEMDFLTDKRASSAGGATNPSRASANTGQLSWDIITKMTPAQYEARRAEIQQWMQRNPPKRF